MRFIVENNSSKTTMSIDYQKLMTTINSLFINFCEINSLKKTEISEERIDLTAASYSSCSIDSDERSLESILEDNLLRVQRTDIFRDLVFRIQRPVEEISQGTSLPSLSFQINFFREVLGS